MSDSTPTTLYRLYDEGGDLLYVGIAGNPGRRFEQHKKDKPWWGSVASIRLEHFRKREQAASAELQSIKDENPRHNIMGRKGPASPLYFHVYSPNVKGDEYVRKPFRHVTCPHCDGSWVNGTHDERVGPHPNAQPFDAAYYPDDCSNCESKFTYPTLEEIKAGVTFPTFPVTTCYPYRGVVDDGWMTAYYQCPECKDHWTCGWSWHG